MRNKLLLIFCFVLAAAPGVNAQYARPAITKGVTLEQKLNSQVPLDLFFNDEAGRSVPLRTYFGEKPVVLELVYFKCPSLCPMTIHESVSSLRRVPLEPGRDYDVVVVSFDPSDTPVEAAQEKASYAREFGKPGFDAGWHFLTGKQEDISKLTAAVGFRYRWDERTHQFVHAGGIMVATPEGKLSRYFYGIQYAPADLRMALVEAASHKIGSPVDYVLLFCFHWDPSQGKYTLTILNVLKVAGAITLLVLAGLIYLLMRNDNRRPEWKGRHVG
ncbi:MAG TPA: SCO family protein [Acidobacteriaceae bacterium]|nr:SCO family protein [Acidobacteriaceae bacterium]